MSIFFLLNHKLSVYAEAMHLRNVYLKDFYILAEYDVQFILETLEDSKGASRSNIPKDGQHNDQKRKSKQPNNDLQNTTQKTKD